MLFLEGCLVLIGKILFILSSICGFTTAPPVTTHGGADLSSSGLTPSATTTNSPGHLSPLPSDDGNVVESSKSPQIETTSSAFAVESSSALSDIFFVPTVKGTNSGVIVPRNISSGVMSTTTSSIPGVGNGTVSSSSPSSTATASSSSDDVSSSQSQDTSSSSLPSTNTTSSTSSIGPSLGTNSTSSSAESSAATSSTSSGSVSSTSSSSASSSSPSSTTAVAPLSIYTATSTESGSTEIVPVKMSEGSDSTPITLPAVSTTVATWQATSRASSVSTEIAGLIPIINSWTKDPTSLKSDLLDKINPVRGDAEHLLSDLGGGGGGGGSSSGCGSSSKRGLLGLFEHLASKLMCVGEDLEKITNSINAGDVDAIKDPLSDLTSDSSDLTDESDDSSSSGSSSTSDSSSSSSCTESSTALQVTVQCIPVSSTISGSGVLTTTCFPSTTATTSGCTVTGYTTTVSTSTSTSDTDVVCATDTCGNACSVGGGPLSGASMAVQATTDEPASVSFSTTPSVPVSSEALAGSTAATDSTPSYFSSSAAAPSKRSFPDDHVSDSEVLNDEALVERALPDVTSPDSDYVRNTNPSWIAKNYEGGTSAQFFDYPVQGRAAAGVNGMFGCTAVIIASGKGVYIAHIWEAPVFVDRLRNPTTDEEFMDSGLYPLRDGNEATVSIPSLIGTQDNPGPLHPSNSPVVFIITPYTSLTEYLQKGLRTTLTYEDRANWLATFIADLFPTTDQTKLLYGYVNREPDESTAPGFLGRTFLEVDPNQYTLTTPQPQGPPLTAQVGRWRLWIEDRMITFQDFVVSQVAGAPAGPTGTTASTMASSSSSLSSSLSTTTPIASSQSSAPNPSSCQYTVTSESAVTDSGAYTLQGTVATRCWCDGSVDAGINTVTGTSSTSYLVCDVPSSITVSTMQPPSPSPPPPSPTSTRPASMSSKDKSHPTYPPSDCRSDTFECAKCYECIEEGEYAGQCRGDGVCWRD
ncbi:MAG: hypothetical protein M1822_006202 [Bathelium mastoideum]|nr:MAG: hypothetical protein M1822_006202 [Bathelium mastoideum]